MYLVIPCMVTRIAECRWYQHCMEVAPFSWEKAERLWDIFRGSCMAQKTVEHWCHLLQKAVPQMRWRARGNCMARSQHHSSESSKISSCKECTRAKETCIEEISLSHRKRNTWGVWDWTWFHNLMNQEESEHLKHVCMRTNLVTEPDTVWQGNESCIENYTGSPFKGTFGRHYSKHIKPQ